LKEFRHKLEGLDEEFSDWTFSTEVQYNNLEHGPYTFVVQTKVGGKIQESEARFSFQIETPWFKTKLFQIVSLSLISSLIIVSFLFQRKRFETEKSEMKSLHQEVVDEKIQLVQKTEKEIIQLKNEKLQSEIQYKTNELASTTMHLVQKQELLSGIESGLQKVVKNKDIPAWQRKEITSIIHMLQQDARIDDDWEKFSAYFDEVHGYFLQRIKEKYPQLSLNDHKLCAYLRMNLSSKEIASLLNISIRGVEGARYRLRKKLGLPENTNLAEFMQQIA
jgi:DNA-binding CsgD family transcriptional regulator